MELDTSVLVIRDEQDIQEVNRGLQLSFEVIEDYAPILDDELKLTVGDIVVVDELYGDGEWGHAFNTASQKSGVVPIRCLEAVCISSK